MLLQSAKLIAAGLAVSAISGAGVGIGTVFGALINAVASKFFMINSFTDTSGLRYVETNDIVYNLTDKHLYALTGVNTGTNTLSSQLVYIGR